MIVKHKNADMVVLDLLLEARDKLCQRIQAKFAQPLSEAQLLLLNEWLVENSKALVAIANLVNEYEAKVREAKIDGMEYMEG
ncbi:MAG: hypothetical protein MJZ99_06960 [Bacteroidales bacterium]|nr:hypothetical protein [Bacteroidales bacterium]